MTDIPDEKTKRLASLNQDVFAVSNSRPASREADAEKPQPKPRPKTAAPRPASKPTPVVTHVVAEPQPGHERQSNTLVIGVMAMAVLLVVGIGAGVVFSYSLWERLDLLETENRALAGVLTGMDQRIAMLEGQLNAAEQETSKMGDDPQANMLQFSSRLRKVALDVSRVTADVARLQKSLENVSAEAERATSVSGEQAGRINSLAGQLAELQGRPVAQAAPAGPVSDAQARQQIADLQARLDRMTNDIRSIYRLLEQTR